MVMNEWLTVKNLRYEIDGKPLLNEVSFCINEGEYLAMIGANGAGKTTLIKCLAGLIDGWSGSILFNGRDVHELSPLDLARWIGYVPQADGRVSPFSVYEFVMMSRYPYYRHRNPDASDRKAVDDALDEMELSAFRERTVASLSGGERQMVYIAAALAQNPRLMILDEPVTFLDYKHTMLVHKRLRHINESRKMAVLSILHDVNEAIHYGDTIMALKNGKTLYHGPSSTLLSDVKMLEQIYDLPFKSLSGQPTGRNLVFPTMEKSEK